MVVGKGEENALGGTNGASESNACSNSEFEDALLSDSMGGV